MIFFLILLAFLMGSFPSGLVLGQLVAGRDVRRLGSGNIGAANVAREAGFKVGVAVAALDILKGLVSVLLGRWAGLDTLALAVVALAAVLGHDFSIYLRFRGGKGVATTFGVAFALAPLVAVLAAVIYVATLAAFRFASLSSLLTLAALPILMGVTKQPPAYVVLASLLFLLAAAKHWPNIVRLLQGTETPFGRRHAG